MKLKFRPIGFNSDLPSSEYGFEHWTTLENIRFDDGYAMAAPGWVDGVEGMLFRPIWILPVYAGPVYYWIYCGNTSDGLFGGIGVTDGENHWDITPAGGLSATTPGQWTGGVLNQIPVMNNGIDAPLFWDLNTGNPAEELPGWPLGQRCAALRPFKYHLIAMNIDNAAGSFPDLVLWSSAAEPGAIPTEWDPDPSNDAGSFSIAATSGAIIDGGQLRDQFVVYKQHSTSMMQYVAGQWVFSNRKAFVNSGILARGCWAEMYGQHFVVTDGDFIKHNGVEVESLISGKVEQFLFRQIDADEYQQTFICASHADNEIWICFPELGQDTCTLALIWDARSGEFGESTLPNIAHMERGIFQGTSANSWDEQTAAWEQQPGRWSEARFNPTTDILVMAKPSTSQLLVHDGFLREGALVPVRLLAESKDLGDAADVKLVRMVQSAVELRGRSANENASFQIRVGVQDEISDPITWGNAVVIEGLDNQRAYMLASGRYISVELSGKYSAEWRLNNVVIDVEKQGAW